MSPCRCACSIARKGQKWVVWFPNHDRNGILDGFGITMDMQRKSGSFSFQNKVVWNDLIFWKCCGWDTNIIKRIQQLICLKSWHNWRNGADVSQKIDCVNSTIHFEKRICTLCTISVETTLHLIYYWRDMRSLLLFCQTVENSNSYISTAFDSEILGGNEKVNFCSNHFFQKEK